MNQQILQKSLTYHNFVAAKRKSTLEEPNYPSYMPEVPKYEHKKVAQPLSAGIHNMVRAFLP